MFPLSSIFQADESLSNFKTGLKKLEFIIYFRVYNFTIKASSDVFLSLKLPTYGYWAHISCYYLGVTIPTCG